jgi:hypothetical protein
VFGAFQLLPSTQTQNTILIQRATTMHVSEGYFKQITVKVKKKS